MRDLRTRKCSFICFLRFLSTMIRVIRWLSTSSMVLLVLPLFLLLFTSFVVTLSLSLSSFSPPLIKRSRLELLSWSSRKTQPMFPPHSPPSWGVLWEDMRCWVRIWSSILSFKTGNFKKQTGSNPVSWTAWLLVRFNANFGPKSAKCIMSIKIFLSKKGVAPNSEGDSWCGCCCSIGCFCGWRSPLSV